MTTPSGSAALRPRTSPVLVSTEWLAAHLSDASEARSAVRVVDVRGKVLPPGNHPRYLPKRAEYDASHLPGAVFVDWTRDIVDLDDQVPAQIARPEAFAAKMRELGIGDGTHVVAYDDYDHAFAGRFAWALRYYGHEAVSLLDGGWQRWTAEGRPTVVDVPRATPATFTARPQAAMRKTADEVVALLGRDGALLIDARAPEQYAGKVSAAGRAGHIPGARNVHYARLVDPATGKFRDPAEMRAIFAEAGVDVASLPRDVIVYCNGGVTCTVPLHALSLLGRDDIAVYDGSWNEWGPDDRRPIRTGSSP